MWTDASGSNALARPKSRTLTLPSSRDHHIRGLQVAVDNPVLVRGLQPLGDLERDRQGSSTGMAPRARTPARLSPSTNSITRKALPLVLPDREEWRYSDG